MIELAVFWLAFLAAHAALLIAFGLSIWGLASALVDLLCSRPPHA